MKRLGTTGTRIGAGRYEGDWGLQLRRINSQVWGLFDNKGQKLYRSDSKWRLTLANMKAYLEPIPQIPGEWKQVNEREWRSEGGWTIHHDTTMCDKIVILTLPPMYIPQEQREPFMRVFDCLARKGKSGNRILLSPQDCGVLLQNLQSAGVWTG
jgi:hypothetical protein